jgi:hypothetical protein
MRRQIEAAGDRAEVRFAGGQIPTQVGQVAVTVVSILNWRNSKSTPITMSERWTTRTSITVLCSTQNQ